MKKKILAILLGAMLLVSMAPVCSMAASGANILPNGDFETGFSGAPGEGWTPTLYTTASYQGSAIGTTGDASSVTSATFGEETILPAVEGSTKFMQINRHNGADGNLAKLENRATGMYIILDNSKLTAGQFYRLEFYVNIPEGALEEGVHANFFFQNGASNHAGVWRSHNWYVPSGVSYRGMNTATDGWEKKGFDFAWDGNTTQLTVALYGAGAAGTMFVDELKLYEIDPPALQEIMGETFEDASLESTINSTTSYKVRNNRGTLSIASDPAGGTNKVMKVVSAVTECLAPLGMNGEGIYREYPLCNATDTLKLSFKLYVPAQTAKAVGETANVYDVDYAIGGATGNGFAFELNYTNKVAGSSSVSGRARPIIKFDKTYAGKWINIEAYLLGFQMARPVLTIPTNSVTEEGNVGPAIILEYYVDDIKLEKINNGGHISSLKAELAVGAGRAYSEGSTDANWGFIAAGTYDTTYAKTETVRPIIAFTPDSVSDKGIAMAMVYKVDGDEQTLVDIKFQEVGRVALTDFTGFTAANAGISCNGLAIDLSGEDFEVGSTYKVEYALWSYAGLAPIGTPVTFDIVD